MAQIKDTELKILTFVGRTGTRSKFIFMPGMMTVILRGPLNPSTLVSYAKAYNAYNHPAAVRACPK